MNKKKLYFLFNYYWVYKIIIIIIITINRDLNYNIFVSTVRFNKYIIIIISVNVFILVI